MDILTRIGMLIGVQGYANIGSYLSMDLRGRQRLSTIMQEDPIVHQTSFCVLEWWHVLEIFGMWTLLLRK